MPVHAKNLTSAAEAVLFSVGEPLEIGKLAEVLSVDEETCRRTLLNLCHLVYLTAFKLPLQ